MHETAAAGAGTIGSLDPAATCGRAIDEAAVREAIRTFVSDTFLVDFTIDAQPDTDLFEADFIDSFGFVDLVTFLEQSFGVRLGDEDFDSPLISSLAGIQTLTLERMRTGGR
jgi:D-alanine--poly(phosphoribitol) ligase subunit 2